MLTFTAQRLLGICVRTARWLLYKPVVFLWGETTTPFWASITITIIHTNINFISTCRSYCDLPYPLLRHPLPLTNFISLTPKLKKETQLSSRAVYGSKIIGGSDLQPIRRRPLGRLLRAPRIPFSNTQNSTQITINLIFTHHSILPHVP